MPENTPAASHAWRSSALFLAVVLIGAGLLSVDLRSADAAPVAASYAGDKAHRWSRLPHPHQRPRRRRLDGRLHDR